MAKLISNPMRFGTSTFNFHRRAFLVSREALDLTGQTSCEGFTITGAQPSDSDRRIIFKIDDVLYKFEDSSLVEFEGKADVDDVLENGNTVAELTALTDIPEFVGKQIYPIIALFSPAGVSVMPSIKIALKARKNTESYTKTVYGWKRDLDLGGDTGAPRIISIEKSDTCTGNATTGVKVSIKDSKDNWSDYVDIDQIVDQEAHGVQFQYNYTVTQVGGDDSALLNKVVCTYTSGAANVSGTNADLYTVVQNYETDLQTCYVIVKHAPLVDSQINAFVNFMSTPSHRELITLGTSNGSKQTLALGVNGVKDAGIDQASIRLYVDGAPLLTFDYNIETSEVTVTFESGKTITASYDYNHGVENWLPMEKVIDSQPYLDDGTYMSRYVYTLADGDTAGKQISNVRLQLTRPTGKVKNQSLGKATGKVQMIALPHRANESTISLNADWNYEPESQILTFVADKNTVLTLSYSWAGEQNVLLGLVAGWSAS